MTTFKNSFTISGIIASDIRTYSFSNSTVTHLNLAFHSKKKYENERGTVFQRISMWKKKDEAETFFADFKKGQAVVISGYFSIDTFITPSTNEKVEELCFIATDIQHASKKEEPEQKTKAKNRRKTNKE